MATTVCSARPKKETSARLTEATWVAENDAMGEDIARFVQTLYLTRYGAHIAPPRGPFLALRDASGSAAFCISAVAWPRLPSAISHTAALPTTFGLLPSSCSACITGTRASCSAPVRISA